MIGLSSGLMLDVERGPDWLFVRLDASAGNDGQSSLLAESVWSVVKQHFVYRLVLDCDQFGLLNSGLIAQLLGLQKRLRKQGGALRLCGLSDDNRQVLRNCRLDGLLPQFESRSQAVLGRRPAQPR